MPINNGLNTVLFELWNMSAIFSEEIKDRIIILSAFTVTAILQVDSVYTLHSRLLCLYHMTKVKGYI